MSKEVEKKLVNFFQKFPLQKFGPGDTILYPTKEVKRIYFLKKGHVNQGTVSEEGQNVSLHIFKPYSYFPMTLSLTKSENHFYFQALNNTQLHSAPIEAVIEFLKNNPEVLFDLAERLSLGINGLLIRLEDLLTKDSYLRLKSVLKFLASRLGKKDPKTNQIKLDLTHSELSSWLGVNRETVTRQMIKLEQEGFILYQGKQLILSPSK